MRSRGRWVGSRSFGFALGVIEFIRCCRVHWGGVVKLLGSLECAQRVVGFIRGRWIHWGPPSVSSCSFGFVRVIRVCPGGRSVAPRGSSGSSWVAGFIEVRPGGRRGRSESLGQLWCALVVVGFVRVRWVNWGALWRRRVRSLSLCSLGCALGRWVRSGSVIGVRSGVRLVSLGSLWCAFQGALRNVGGCLVD